MNASDLTPAQKRILVEIAAGPKTYGAACYRSIKALVDAGLVTLETTDAPRDSSHFSNLAGTVKHLTVTLR